MGGGPGVGFVGVRWGGGGWGGGGGGSTIYIYIIYIWSGPGPGRVPILGSKNWSSFCPTFWTVSRQFLSRFDKRQSCHVDDKIL